VLRFALLGHVAGDLGKADVAAAGIAHRLDHRRRPEPAAVLADTPALLFGPPAAAGARQNLAPHIGRFVFGRKEQREMLADDLGSAVALDPLGPGVPGADHAIAIQETDRAVGDRTDQELEPIGGRQFLYGTGKLEFHFVHIAP
jgi:hypothetical protein